MDVELSDAQRMIRDATREFCRREIEPIADRIDAEDWFPRELWPKLGALGVLGVMAPVEYGGAGADLLSGVLVIEEIAKVSASIALSYGAHANLCVNNITLNASDAQRRRYLPALCDGSAIGALALTEPGGRLGRRRHPHHGPPRGRRLRPQRPQDVHHQRLRGRHPGALRQDRPRRRLARHHRLPRRERLPRLRRRPAARQAPGIAGRPRPSCCSTTARCRPATSSAKWVAACR